MTEERKTWTSAWEAQRVRSLTLMDGSRVGIANLDAILKEVAELNLTDAGAIKKELLKRVKAYNYVARSAEYDYSSALLREYRRKFQDTERRWNLTTTSPRNIHPLSRNRTRKAHTKMSVKLIFDESLFDRVKENVEMEVNGKSVGQCLEHAFQEQPELKKVIFRENYEPISGVFFKINEKFIYSEISEILVRQVSDGDTIRIVNFTGGWWGGG